MPKPFSIAEEVRGPTDDERKVVGFVLNELLRAQEERSLAVAESRSLLKDMTRVKQWLRLWMTRYGVGELGSRDGGRRFVRKKRKVYKSVNVDTLLDWIEGDFGTEVRRQYDERIKKAKKTVVRETDEYKITFCGVRKRGEHNPGAMPPRRRRSPQ